MKIVNCKLKIKSLLSRRLFVSLLALIFVVTAGLFWLRLSRPASAAWFDDNWAYWQIDDTDYHMDTSASTSLK